MRVLPTLLGAGFAVLSVAACAPRTGAEPEAPIAMEGGGLETGSYAPIFERYLPDTGIPGERILDTDIHPG